MDMKFLFALFLYGVAYAAASPTCSQSELDKCNVDNFVSDGKDSKETESLNILCKLMGCMKDFKSRCGVESVGALDQSALIQSEKFHRALCEKDSGELRKKYLENINCINRVMKSSDECRIKETIVFKDPKYCPLIAESWECLNDMIGRECGKDARELNIAVAPGLEFHGC